MKTILMLSLGAWVFANSAQEKPFSIDGTYQIRPGFNVTISTESDGVFIQATGKPREKLVRSSEHVYEIESIGGSVDVSLIAEGQPRYLVVRMYGQTFHAPDTAAEEPAETRKEIEVPAEVLAVYGGAYKLTEDAVLTVSAEDGKLFAQLGEQPKLQVYAETPDIFFYKVVKASLEFVKTSEVEVAYVLLRQNGVIMRATKI